MKSQDNVEITSISVLGADGFAVLSEGQINYLKNQIAPTAIKAYVDCEKAKKLELEKPAPVEEAILE